MCCLTRNAVKADSVIQVYPDKSHDIMKHSSLYLLLLLIVAAFAGAGSMRSERRGWDRVAADRKAAYLYLQSLDAFINENYGLYGELLTRAYCIDPSDPELRSRYGEWLLLTRADDSAMVDRGFEMMLESYSRRPEDYYEAVQLINLTNNFRRFDDQSRVVELMHKAYPDRNEVTLQLAKNYVFRAMRGDTAASRRAIAMFDSLETALGKSSQISAFKIQTWLAKGDTASVIEELNSLAASSPADPMTAIDVSRFYNAINRPDSTAAYLDRACRLDSTNGMAILLRANFYKERGDSATFEREVIKAIRSTDLDVETKLQLMGSTVMNLPDDSITRSRTNELFETLLDVNPGEYEIHQLYGYWLAKNADYARAAEQAGYAIALDGRHPGDWQTMARMQISAGDTIGAEQTMSRAAVRFADDLETRRLNAVIISILGKPAEAAASLEGFDVSKIETPDERSQFESLRGDLFYQAGKADSAFEAYRKAIDYNPLNYMALNNIAYYYAEADTLLDEAEKYASRAVGHEPDNPTFIDTYAWVFFKKKNYGDAKTQIDRAIDCLNFKNEAEDIDAQLAAGDTVTSDTVTVDNIEIAVPENVTGDAEVVEEVVEETETGNSDIYEHAGDIYFMYGDTISAVKFWQKALGFEDIEADARRRLESKIKHRRITDD